MSNAKVRANWSGILATIIGVAALLPLLVHSTVKCSTHSLSYNWLILAIASQIFWFVYGFSNQMSPIILAACLFFSAYVYLVFLKLYHNKYGVEPNDDDSG